VIAPFLIEGLDESPGEVKTTQRWPRSRASVTSLRSCVVLPAPVVPISMAWVCSSRQG
jgi:hypothetical protein